MINIDMTHTHTLYACPFRYPHIHYMAFGRYVLGPIGNEANIIIQYYLSPCRLSTDPKIYDLE